jgi:hypothetical protein
LTRTAAAEIVPSQGRIHRTSHSASTYPMRGGSAWIATLAAAFRTGQVKRHRIPPCQIGTRSGGLARRRRI